MKRLLLILALTAFALSLYAQIKQVAKNPLAQIPSSFKYKKELKDIAFIPGGMFANMSEPPKKYTITIDFSFGALTPGYLNGRDSLMLKSYKEPVAKQLLIAKKETSNNEYREFVNYVRDSIAHILLGHFTVKDGKQLVNWNEKIDWSHGRLDPMFYEAPLWMRDKIKRTLDFNVGKWFYKLPTGENIAVYPDTLIWKRENYSNPALIIREAKIVAPLQYNEHYEAPKSIVVAPVEKIQSAVVATDTTKIRRRKRIPKDGYNLMPDTLSLLAEQEAKYRDEKYGMLYHDPMPEAYFSHPSYGNYPVVGITQQQALAYCHWKTQQWNNALLATGYLAHKFKVTLPTESEWEFAAYEKLDKMEIRKFRSKPDSPYIDFGRKKTFNMFGFSKKKIGYNCNFGLISDENDFILKAYIDDGALYTAPVNSYKPDANGLYNLHGNVAEWTIENGSYQYQSIKGEKDKQLKLLNLHFPKSPLANKNADEINDYLKQYVIVKGGSWLNGPYYLQSAVNQYFKADEAHSYIGFRVVIKLEEK